MEKNKELVKILSFAIPFTVDKYNIIEKKDFDIFIPKEKKQPMIFRSKKNDKTVYDIIFVENIERVLIELFYSFNGSFDVEDLLNICKLKSDIISNRIVFYEGDISFYYYKNGKDLKDKKIMSLSKSKLTKDNKYFNYWDFNLLNENSFIPILKTNNEKERNEFYFHIDDQKIYFSFNVKEDFPLEIKRWEVGDNFYEEKEYVNDMVRLERPLVFKPSFLLLKNNKLIDFKCIVNKKDITEDYKELLKALEIKDPYKHSFKDEEIIIINKFINEKINSLNNKK